MRRDRLERARQQGVDETMEVLGPVLEGYEEDLTAAVQQLKDSVVTIRELGETAQHAVGIARESVAFAAGMRAVSEAFAERLSKGVDTEVMSMEELQVLAEAVPQWSITVGFANGVAVKKYHRTINADELVPERRQGGELAHDTYLSLADYEHSDLGLAQIFGTYGFMGDKVNGRYYELTFTAEEATPINYRDFGRVLDAEEYLIKEGYILPPTELEVADQADQLRTATS